MDLLPVLGSRLSLPAAPWIMAQTWRNLLFAHWPVAPERLRPLVPPGLTLDTFDGMAWLGVVAFRLSGVRFRGTPALPGVSAFPEINVRTYVTCGGAPGVLFLSLDANNPPGIAVARPLFRLPYSYSRIAFAESAEGHPLPEPAPGRRPPARRLRRHVPAGRPDHTGAARLARCLAHRALRLLHGGAGRGALSLRNSARAVGAAAGGGRHPREHDGGGARPAAGGPPAAALRASHARRLLAAAPAARRPGAGRGLLRGAAGLVVRRGPALDPHNGQGYNAGEWRPAPEGVPHEADRPDPVPQRRAIAADRPRHDPAPGGGGRRGRGADHRRRQPRPHRRRGPRARRRPYRAPHRQPGAGRRLPDRPRRLPAPGRRYHRQHRRRQPVSRRTASPT